MIPKLTFATLVGLVPRSRFASEAIGDRCYSSDHRIKGIGFEGSESHPPGLGNWTSDPVRRNQMSGAAKTVQRYGRGGL